MSIEHGLDVNTLLFFNNEWWSKKFKLPIKEKYR